MKNVSKHATTDDLVQYGSITKMFTGSLVIKLIRKGIIQYTTTLGDIFPKKFNVSNKDSWPNAWKAVTIKELLNMTSGVPAYLRSKGVWLKMNPHKAYSKDALINLVSQYQKKSGCVRKNGCFKPSSRWFYSNTNYIILGLVVEKYYKTSFKDAFDQTILQTFQKKPMAIYYYLDYPKNVRRRMLHGYFELSAIKGNPYLPLGKDVFNIPMYTMQSAGALTGTTNALTQIIRAFFHNKIIPTRTVTQKKNIFNPRFSS
jgi:D-alanyl-D-alanine carboxypeptidase